MSQVAHQGGAYPSYCSMKRLGVFLLLPGWDARPLQGYPSIKLPSTCLNTWVERDTVSQSKLSVSKIDTVFSDSAVYTCLNYYPCHSQEYHVAQNTITCSIFGQLFIKFEPQKGLGLICSLKA